MKLVLRSRAAIGPAIVLAVNLLLLAAVLANLGEDRAALSVRSDWNAGLSASMGSIFSRKPIDAYKQVLAKPIFFKSREPFVAAPPRSSLAAIQPRPVTDPNIALGGIMINEGARKAYVFVRNGASAQWVAEGGEFMGWHIGSINSVSAKLEQGGRVIDLQLYPKE